MVIFATQDGHLNVMLEMGVVKQRNEITCVIL
jgi:hypothetical protein